MIWPAVLKGQLVARFMNPILVHLVHCTAQWRRRAASCYISMDILQQQQQQQQQCYSMGFRDWLKCPTGHVPQSYVNKQVDSSCAITARGIGSRLPQITCVLFANVTFLMLRPQLSMTSLTMLSSGTSRPNGFG